ncbi:proteasome assembly chaperone 2-like [Glandiceps talaboti]
MDSVFVGCPNTPKDFKGYTLILPSVSVGNVGQLSVDLLVTTLELVKVGYIHTDCVLPVCGNDAFSQSRDTQGSLVTTTEVYFSEEKKLVVVQQRAPYVKGKQKEYCERLIEWIQSYHFDKVLLLTSSYAHERVDSQLQGTPLRYIATPVLQQTCGSILKDELKWFQLEKRESVWGKAAEDSKQEIPEEAKNIFIPGGGIARRLFIQGCKDNIPLAVVLVFCAEGNNVPDAMILASSINEWLKLLPSIQSSTTSTQQWKIPNSWNLLFGSSFDKTIY